jgi:hypothetical protein
MCSKFLGTISGIATIDRGRAVSGFCEQMQVRTRLRLCKCHGGTQARVGCSSTASRWWIVSVTGANTKASQCNRREGGFRAAAFCKADARSGAKPIPTSGLAGRTAVMETANGTGRMPLYDSRWPFPDARGPREKRRWARPGSISDPYPIASAT